MTSNEYGDADKPPRPARTLRRFRRPGLLIPFVVAYISILRMEPAGILPAADQALI